MISLLYHTTRQHDHQPEHLEYEYLILSPFYYLKHMYVVYRKGENETEIQETIYIYCDATNYQIQSYWTDEFKVNLLLLN